MQFLFNGKWVWILVSVIGILEAKQNPKGVGKILDFKVCDTTADNPLEIKDLYLDNVENGFKKFTAEFHITRELSPDLYYTIRVEQYKNGNWDFVIDQEGQACDILDEYVGDAWDVVRKAADPPIPEKCSGPVGTYKFKDLQITRDEFIPDALYGKIRVLIKLYDNKDTEAYFACVMVTLEIFQRTPGT